MAHPGWVGIGARDDRCLEECGELVAAIGKAKRFGYGTRWPDESAPSNAERILAEIEDVESACLQLRGWLIQEELV